MSGREESLSCLEGPVHLPLSPQLVSPVTQPGSQEVSVGQDHDGDGGVRVHGWGIPAEEEDQVVHQELVVQQPQAEYAQQPETLFSDRFHFDLQQSPCGY